MGKIVASLSAGVRNAALAALRNPRCGRMLSFVRGLSLPQRLRALVKCKQGKRERQTDEAISAIAEAAVLRIMRTPNKVPAFAPGLTLAQRMELLEKDRQERQDDERSAMVEAAVREAMRTLNKAPAFAPGLTLEQRMALLKKDKRERQQHPD